MKNITITALLVSNLFTGTMLYAFACGQIERHQNDYLTEVSAPVKLARK